MCTFLQKMLDNNKNWMDIIWGPDLEMEEFILDKEEEAKLINLLNSVVCY